jgi:anti-anti-sigma factor
MEIFTQLTDIGFLVSMRGVLDDLTSEAIKKELQVVFLQRKRFLLLDFTDVTLVTASGLRNLLPYVRQIQQQKKEIILFNLNQEVHHLLDSSGFNSLVVVVDSLDAAIKYAFAKNIAPR